MRKQLTSSQAHDIGIYRMLKKEAKEITGGLSKPNKMPGPAYNLPARACLTGQKLVKVPGSTCSGCYALKGRYRFPNVKDAMQRRLDRSPRRASWLHLMYKATRSRRAPGHSYGQRILFLNFLELHQDLKILRIAPRESAASASSPASACTLRIC